MADQKPTTGMLIDGVFASEAIDSSGEVVSLEGMDITSMEEGQSVANYEHLGEDGNYGREIVGKIIYVRKVFKESDCENDRQRDYWKQLKGIPFLYGVVRLYDGAGHEGAKALAAQIRDHVANQEPILVRYSIEGTTTKKEGHKIVSSIAKKVALTLKPCNKTCDSGLLADPNAPEGFPTVKKAEALFVDPEFAPLGGVVELTCNPCMDGKTEASMRLLANAMTLRTIRKALTAGMPSGAPSTLTGGAALQREDFVRNNAKATLRDYGWSKPFRRNEFRQFAKAKLPEVSDEFLDHFTDVAEAVSIKKSIENLAKALPKTSTKAATPKPAGKVAVKSKAPAVIIPPQHQAVNHAVLEDIPDTHEDLPDEIVPKKGGGGNRKISAGTYRGKRLRPNPGMTRPVFDAKKGVLQTPVGNFKAYLPAHDGPESEAHYLKTLAHPDIEAAMDTALENWTKVHRLLKAGKLPPEVVMHAVMFSQLSPNKPVPTQEIQYARLVDAMHATGIDPRHPGFEDIEEPYTNLDHPTRLPHTSRQEFARNPAYYTGGKVGVEYDKDGNPIGKPSDTGRLPGELLSGRPLFQDFLKRATQYHKLHGSMVDLVSRHRHNGLDAVTELMNQKKAATNHSNVRRAAIKAGKQDPGEFTGITIPGLKVKTGLYTYGMLGGGDSLVPDTHEVRNLYGLDLHKDADTIEYLKHMHWRPTNMDTIMRPLNQWYLNNHPAVKYTLEHPKWKHHFERPQDALFPAFWRHWLTIQPHERFLGLPNMSEQAGTTHAPYWDTIRPYVDEALNKTDDSDSTVPLRTAMVHQQYVKDYGEIPAMLMFYHHLVPKLLEAAAGRERTGSDMQFLAKARQIEAGLVELRKTISDAIEGVVPAPEVHAVDLKLNGKTHPAGRFMIHDGRIHHLEDYHGVLDSMLPEGDIDATTVSRLHGLKWSPKLKMRNDSQPSPTVGPQPEPQSEIQVTPVTPPPPPPIFEYSRPGMEKPHVVEFSSNGPALDGKALSDAELQLMLSNAQKGLASIRWKRGKIQDIHLDSDLNKAEGSLQDMDAEDALQHVRAAVAAGHVHPDVERALTSHLFQDPMTQLGNKYAYQKFRSREKPGVYLSMDGNSFKHVNDTYGHDAGDAAIKAMGGALKIAAEKVGTGKLFRPGGDEFVAHFPSYEEASRFMRHATKHLDAVPPVAGVHKLSMSFGAGTDFESADKALYHAKAQKVDSKTGRAAFHPSKTPHFAHSLVPGSEGPIRLHSEAPPVAALPMPKASPAPDIKAAS